MERGLVEGRTMERAAAVAYMKHQAEQTKMHSRKATTPMERKLMELAAGVIQSMAEAVENGEHLR
jgi:hypothetical protein